MDKEFKKTQLMMIKLDFTDMIVRSIARVWIVAIGIGSTIYTSLYGLKNLIELIWLGPK